MSQLTLFILSVYSYNSLLCLIKNLHGGLASVWFCGFWVNIRDAIVTAMA